MTLRVVGAGVGRTGTLSLKLALERLLDGRCYHMFEVVGRPADVPVWHRAFDRDPPDWGEFLADFRATVDWPACAFWRELSEAFPDALVLLSVRDADAWWKSANNTIFEGMSRGAPTEGELVAWWKMTQRMMEAFTPDWQDRAGAIAAYKRHNDTVRETIGGDRLLEWHPGDGWAPICSALGVPVPDEPFPHVNTTDEFRAQFATDRNN
jgi:Sulfotransferase domain